MSAPKKSKALLKFEKAIGIMDDELLNDESREFRDRLRAALAPHAPLPSPKPSKSARINIYGTTKKGGKSAKKSRKSRKTAKNTR